MRIRVSEFARKLLECPFTRKQLYRLGWKNGGAVYDQAGNRVATVEVKK